MWNVHSARAISPARRLDVPACQALAEEWINEQFQPGLWYELRYAPDAAGNLTDIQVALLRRRPAPTLTTSRMRQKDGTPAPKPVWGSLWFSESSIPIPVICAKSSTQCGMPQPGESLSPELVAMAHEGTCVKRNERDRRVILRADGEYFVLERPRPIPYHKANDRCPDGKFFRRFLPPGGLSAYHRDRGSIGR